MRLTSIHAFLFNIETRPLKRFINLVPYIDLYGIVKIPLRDRNSKLYSNMFLFVYSKTLEKGDRLGIYLKMNNNIVSNLIICGIVLVIVKHLKFAIKTLFAKVHSYNFKFNLCCKRSN